MSYPYASKIVVTNADTKLITILISSVFVKVKLIPKYLNNNIVIIVLIINDTNPNVTMLNGNETSLTRGLIIFTNTV
jgi:hypothetical protein